MTEKMTESETPQTPALAETATNQTKSSTAASPTIPPQDLDTAISKAAHQVQLIKFPTAHQVQLIKFPTAHQRPIRYATYAIEEAMRRKQSNRLSSDDVARKWLHAANEEIGIWLKQTKQMVDEVEKAGSGEADGEE
jgi:hypothetical protein